MLGKYTLESVMPYWKPLLAAVNPASRYSNPAMSRLAREDIEPA